MTDITKLPALFRKLILSNHSPLWFAELLEDALPKWTKITTDKDTWPEDGCVYLVVHKYFKYPFATTIERIEFNIKSWVKSEMWWRPLCDLDRPPQ